MWFSRAKTIEGFAYLIAWLGFIFLIAITCVALLAEAVRSSPSRTWKNNYNVFVLGGAYVVVVCRVFSEISSWDGVCARTAEGVKTLGWH